MVLICKAVTGTWFDMRLPCRPAPLRYSEVFSSIEGQAEVKVG